MREMEKELNTKYYEEQIYTRMSVKQESFTTQELVKVFNNSFEIPVSEEWVEELLWDMLENYPIIPNMLGYVNDKFLFMWKIGTGE